MSKEKLYTLYTNCTCRVIFYKHIFHGHEFLWGYMSADRIQMLWMPTPFDLPACMTLSHIIDSPYMCRSIAYTVRAYLPVCQRLGTCMTNWVIYRRSLFVALRGIKVPLTRKIIISVNEAVPWVKTNGDTKSCYTYVQIGKNLQLPVAVLLKVSHFLMTSQGERFAELSYCKCEYSSSIPAQKRSHVVASAMPKRWIAAGCGDKGCDRDWRVSSG